MDFPRLPEGSAYENQWEALSAWFLGSKAENLPLLEELVGRVVESHGGHRRDHFPQDRGYITPELQNSVAYRSEVEQMKEELERVLKDLKSSVPFYSTRYRGHMNWETTLPATVGYLAGLLYNQNNIASESGPATSLMELEVGQQLCTMLGYTVGVGAGAPWAHMCSGGTLANIEATWAARGLCLYALAVRNAVKEEAGLAGGAGCQVMVARLGLPVALLKAENWDLLNLNLNQVLALEEEVAEAAGVERAVVAAAARRFSVEEVGVHQFVTDNQLEGAGVVLAPASAHYSWPKAVNVLGLGGSAVRTVALDAEGRQDMVALRCQLEDCLADRTPVLMVVAVMGTTDEGAIDPLVDILNLRREFEGLGLSFLVHADAAWGGYMCTMLDRTEGKHTLHRKSTSTRQLTEGLKESYVLPSPLSHHSRASLSALSDADTVTIDPHKTGLVPYPAGAICYRNGDLSRFVTFSTPVVSGDGTTVGMAGLEGSRAGAPAVATLLSHRVLGLDPRGYGRIQAQCVTGAKMFYCLLVTLSEPKDPFLVVPLRPLPASMQGEEAATYIRTHILGRPFSELVKDPVARAFLSQVGPDAMVNAFAVNLRNNTDLGLVERLCSLVFRRLSAPSLVDGPPAAPALYLARSSRGPAAGKKTFARLKALIGLPEGPGALPFLVSTSLNPWQSSHQDLVWIRDTLRQALHCSVGQIRDQPLLHTFITFTPPASSFLCHYVHSAEEGRGYQALVRVQVKGDVGHLLPPLHLTLNIRLTLPSLAVDSPTWIPATFTDREGQGVWVQVKVEEVLVMRRVHDLLQPHHLLSGAPGSLQLSCLDQHHQWVAGVEVVQGEVPAELLERGLEVQVMEVRGGPEVHQGQTGWSPGWAGMVQTLKELGGEAAGEECKVHFVGSGGAQREVTLVMGGARWMESSQSPSCLDSDKLVKRG